MKKYFKYIFIMLISFLTIVNGEEIREEWIKSFGGSSYDEFYSVIAVEDGFVAVGESESEDAGFENKGYYDAIIVKYDKLGNQEWVKSFGGKGYDKFSSLIEVEDGYVAVGVSGSEDAGFENKGVYDAIIVKYDKKGNQEWVKNFGGSEDDYFYSVIVVEDGYVAVGVSGSEDAGFENKGYYDAIIVKYDKSGNQKWVYNLGSADSVTVFASISKAKDGFIVAGFTNSKELGFDLKTEYASIIVKYTDPDIISSELNKLLEELNSLIKEDDKENKNFYEEVKESIDKYNTEELKGKREETKKRIEDLKNKDDKVKNPETGIVGYSLLLIMIILLSIYGLNYKKKYL